VGWGCPSREAIAVGLSGTLFSVYAEHEGTNVGYGRIFGDGGFTFYVQDVMVRPTFQKRGVGRLIMARIMEHIRTTYGKGSMVCLMSARGKGSFYKAFGFIERPNEARSALLDLVGGLSQERLDSKPSEERWSVGEILHDLILVEAAVEKLLARLAERARKRAPGAAGKGEGSPGGVVSLPAEIASRTTELPVFPSAVPQHGLHADLLVHQLVQGRKGLIACAQGSVGRDMGAYTFPHPALGRLNFHQWLLFVAGHERGHTDQARALMGGFPAFRW